MVRETMMTLPDEVLAVTRKLVEQADALLVEPDVDALWDMRVDIPASSQFITDTDITNVLKDVIELYLASSRFQKDPSPITQAALAKDVEKVRDFL